MNRRNQRGFTLIEIVIVISVILILLSVALETYSRSITRAREVVLRENLSTLEKVVDRYMVDKKGAPQSLEDLVKAGYLNDVPNDITGKSDTWRAEPEDPQNCLDPNKCGIARVHSGSEAIATDGTAYSSWTAKGPPS